jgi:predicted glycoside hydrolase/deacetylase ChbG (UPF0249 family)
MKAVLRIILASLFGLLVITTIQAQSVAEKLGYEKDAKLLILHADDLGLAHSVNEASIKAFEESGISSASIMVPCPWFPEIAAYAKNNPQYDFGLHLTLTAEWKHLRWGGVADAADIPSLLNEQGFMYGSVAEVVQHASPEDVETEIRAQIDRALAFGVDVTHLDSHMGTLFATPAFFEIYLKLGAEYKIPVFVPMNAAQGRPELTALLGDGFIAVDNYYMMGENRDTSAWTPFYTDIVDQLPEGLNLIIIHLALDNTEMKAVAIDHPDFGSTWRQNDLNTVLSPEFKQDLKEKNIQLVTWRQVKTLMNGAE